MTSLINTGMGPMLIAFMVILCIYALVGVILCFYFAFKYYCCKNRDRPAIQLPDEFSDFLVKK